ncbi:MAG: hypothetical protein IKD79_07425 [Oscillospiraceae bacterium]|nr:hypothetical protein [Oscillospiraceae bacterium]
MNDRQLFHETFSRLHASEDTITEVLEMAREQDYRKTMKKSARTGVLIALAAVLLMGGALAATVYRLRTEPVGDLAAAVTLAAESGQEGAVAFDAEGAEGTYTGLEFSAGWLPEGMENVVGETIKWWKTDDQQTGISLAQWPLTAGKEVFCQVIPDVTERTELEVNGHEAVLIRTSAMWDRMFVSYPELCAVAEIMFSDSLTREELVEFAENLSVTAGAGGADLDYIEAIYRDERETLESGAWVYESRDEFDYADRPEEDEVLYMDPAQTAAAENMANARELGESFTIRTMDFRGDGVPHYVDVTVKVTDCAIADDVSILRDVNYLDSSVAKLLDENGGLPRDTLRFFAAGDGITTPGQEVLAEQAQQPKLAAVTVEYTNDTEETIRDITYGGSLMALEETADGWRAYVPQPEGGPVDYDDCAGECGESLQTMRYYDLLDTESNGGNHIIDLAPGESVTVQMAFVVNECQADHLWFWFDTGMNEVSEGYVALRP